MRVNLIRYDWLLCNPITLPTVLIKPIACHDRH